ncbi:MAG: pilus assembly protein TadG-related protein [Terracidiphilus sp.]
MRKGSKSFLLRVFKEQSGQLLPMFAIMTVVFFGLAGITLDLGKAYVCYRELQSSTDAAALAGAQALSVTNSTQATVSTAVTNFSSVSPGVNVNANLPNTTITTTFKCLTTLANAGVLCASSNTGFNAIQVTQTASVPTLFIRVLGAIGINSAKFINLSSTATAAMRGSGAQYNVAIVADTTASMNNQDSDANCGSTRISCALQGIQTLLKGLTPCAGITTTTCVAFDQVSLFTFPNIRANTAVDDTACNSANPTVLPYSTPAPGATWVATNFSSTAPTYQVTSYLSNYSSNNLVNGSPNTSSPLVIAAGNGGSSCPGLAAVGGEGTFYAGAIYAAISSLVYAQINNPGSENALIILSDGDANATSGHMTASNGLTLTATGVYPSLKDQCQQAITAANAAKQIPNTTVFTIAYGASNSSSGSCSTDSPSISACSALQQMATSSTYFYSDATAAQNKGQCVSSVNSNFNSLTSIFQNVAGHLQNARLIPNGTT